MTGAEHCAEAERLIRECTGKEVTVAAVTGVMSVAQAHVLLAIAGWVAALAGAEPQPPGGTS